MKNKKQIAFVMESMPVGGTEKALIELLKSVDYKKYSVSLYLSDTSGMVTRSIPAEVHIKFWNCASRDKIKNDLQSLKLIGLLQDLMYRILIRSNNPNWRKTKYYSVLCYPQYSNIYYDCVIAYQINDPAVVSSALYRLSGAKKAAFYHGKSAAPIKDNIFFDRVYKKFDCIFCVSKSAQIEFHSDFPSSKNKTTVLHNVLDISRINNSANIKCNYSGKNTGQIILTVGRLSHEKGQDMIPQITRILLNNGYEIYWYLVGDGPLRATVEAEIQKYDVAEHVILLGTQTNPYPYIKNCDIYVQTSFSEGWCLTVQEAKILQKPIVTTPLPVMHEQIVSGENGLIAKAVTPEALAESIQQLLDNPELREKFVKNLSHEVCDNSGELQKLYDFIES